MKIKLPSGREIGDGCRPFVIAEIGSNWQSLGDCLTSIRLARACGADAVKFQLFNYKSLYGFDLSFYGIVDNPGDDEMPGTLQIKWLPQLKEQADNVGIEFMCSAFSPELIEAVDPYVSIHKMASAEATHVRMLEKLRNIGKPVIMSTGAKGVVDLGQALATLRQGEHHTRHIPPEVILTYCIGSYPAKWTLLSNIKLLREVFGTLVGFSDHSLDIYTNPMYSLLAGACVIEKHVTFIDANTPDSPHSLNEREFGAFMAGIRGLVKPKIKPTPEERSFILRHNRRLIATRDIKQGDEFVEGQNFGIYRSLKDDTHAFSPFLINEVNGRVALRNIEAGAGIGPGDV